MSERLKEALNDATTVLDQFYCSTGSAKAYRLVGQLMDFKMELDTGVSL